MLIFGEHARNYFKYSYQCQTLFGSASRIRTYDLELRSLLLYPAELWRHFPHFTTRRFYGKII